MISAINATTFSAQCGDVDHKTVIGGKDDKAFIPCFTSAFFDNKLFMHWNRRDKKSIPADKVSGKAEIGGDDRDIFHIVGDRLEWDIGFSFCPENLTIEFEIKHSPGIEFLFQDTLENEWKRNSEGMTLEEYLACNNRPPEIEGSYAVYCNKKNNKYKTGKLCHIPRPFVYHETDPKITEWATIRIEPTDDDCIKKCFIDLPSAFMRLADYSIGDVILDPSIGYTTAGASLFQADSSTISRGSLYAPRTAEDNESVIALYFHGRAANDGDHANLGVYTMSAGMLASLVGSSTQVEVSINGGTPTWWHTDVDEALSSGVAHGIAVAWNSASGYVHMSYDSGSGTNRTYGSVAYLAATWSSGGTGATLYSIYAETEITSGASAVPVFVNHFRQQGAM